MVSVIMAAYNTRGYVSTALESIFAQTYSDFQIIVVDDASTDGTADILRSYKDPRLIVLRNETRRGAAFSRNRAMDEATGEYLSVLDADDFWASDKLEEQVAFMNDRPTAAGVGSYVYETDESGRRIRAVRFPVYPGQIRCSTFFRCSVVHSSVMLRRSFMSDNDLRYNEAFPGSHDFELWSRAVFAGDFHHIPRYLTYYRRNPGQISEDLTGTQKEHAVKVYRTLLQKMGYEPTKNELDCHLRLAGIDTDREDEKTKCKNVLDWCDKLYHRNLEKMLFRQYLFANEILLRFLKYCYDNSLGFFRTLRLMIALHWRMKWCFFPYFQLFQRISIKYKDV
jgi:glycosyltransferase involved in cell wall biosynthesis